MKVLLMAAGVGSRISRHLQGQPKCCVEIENKILIKYTFDMLSSLGVNEIGIITGYAEKYILDALNGYKFKHFRNNFFDVTNSIASVYFAKDFLSDDEDLILMNADVFIEKDGLEKLFKIQKSPLFLADSSRTIEADYKFAWEDGKLVKFGKDLSDDEVHGEYVGIAKISKNDIGFFRKKLINYIENQKHHFWWEDVFYRNIKDKNVFIEDINGIFWAEVDYIEDYERIQKYLRQKNG